MAPDDVESEDEFESFHGIVECEDADGWFSPAPEKTKKKRIIKVAQNTLLGRMILKDPQKALKHDLVAVPSWVHNKPWPPPPVKVVKTVKKPKKVDKEENSETVSLRKRMQMQKSKSKRWEDSAPSVTQAAASIKAAGTLLALRKSIEEKRPKGNTVGSSPTKQKLWLESSSSNDTHRGSLDEAGVSCMSDLELGVACMGLTRKQEYRNVFKRIAVPGAGLGRVGIVKALQQADHVPVSVEEQRLFANLQEQIIQHTRGKDPHNNPLTDPQGHWTLHEFILMSEAMREVSSRRLKLANQEAAASFNMSCTEVGELRAVFTRFDTDASGTIDQQELKDLLETIDIHLSDEDYGRLLDSCNLAAVEALDFKQFMTVAIQLDEITRAPNAAKTITVRSTKRAVGNAPTKRAPPRVSTSERHTGKAAMSMVAKQQTIQMSKMDSVTESDAC
jgi:hypothetical protein